MASQKTIAAAAAAAAAWWTHFCFAGESKEEKKNRQNISGEARIGRSIFGKDFAGDRDHERGISAEN